MGELLIRYLPPVAAWLLVLVWRSQDDAIRRLWLGLAVSLTVLTPAGQSAVAAVTGEHDFVRLLGHAGMVLVAWSAHDFLAHLNGLRRSRWSKWWTAGMFAVMCVLFALKPNLLPQSPWVFEYWVAYLLTLTPAFGNVIRLGLRFARATSDRALRVGLHLIVSGTALALVYLVNRVVRVGAGRFDYQYRLGYQFWVSAVAPNAAHALVLLGAAIPAVAAWRRRYRQYTQLRPLWQLLAAAEPSIALNPRVGWWNMRLRVYRRVIEIRDGLLDLQPYRDADVAGAARERAAGPAEVEAAVIAAAIEARAGGVEPARTEPVAGGPDLASDTAFLCEVAEEMASVGGFSRQAKCRTVAESPDS
ncbi:MAB_1171c family putative transporter [Amycolatopsis benzoatilytica]|uniref:MAB_1171c family putative transporter n=1 Tax=Amycolatopsis benzoatilytica TaxID=346045 RepID=UPI00035D12FA|nr:MAB_1171c family putative transporter [Amycolatopsis benzoatilytica]